MAKPDKLSRAILKYLTKRPQGEFCSLGAIWDSTADIPLSDLCAAVERAPAEVLASVSFLCSRGLAEYRTLRSRSGPVNVAFALTHEGYHFKEFQTLSAMDRWKERAYGFVTGALSTVLTGVILEWLLR